MDAKSYALSKKYTNLVAVGLTSATVDDVNKSITFTLAADGSTHTIHFDQPKDGISITNISVDANNNLVCTMSDGTEYKSKIDLLDNVYTKAETDTLLLDKAEKNHNHDSAYASKDTEHEHSNKETLDKFGVNDGGKLTFDGNVVTPEASDLSDYLKKTDAQSTYVAKETGKGLSENDFTTVLKDAYDKAVEDSHTHSNKSIIDKFSESADGALLYDGQSIEADLSTVYKKTETYSQTEADNKFVAKESGKGLSANDLTNDLKSSYDDAVTAKHTHENGTVLDGITAEKVESWDKAEANVQSDWNETDDTADGFIKNKPTIPDITGLATETYVDNKVADYTKTADLADVATSGSYNDLSDKPNIPSLDGYAKTSEIPTKVSELENDSNYLSSIPEEYVTETELEAKGYLTEHQDISGKVDKVEGKSLIADTEIARLASVDNYDDTDIRTELANKADTTAIPSKVSELTNDSNYQTAEQVNSTVTTEIAKVVADAPESLNTLKEMSDWIAGHEDDASAMNSAISDNKTAIASLQSGKADKSEIPTTVAELSDSEDYAKKTDLHSHENKTVLDGITSTKVSNWDSAKTHADSAHAPSTAQANVLEIVKVNGTALTPSSKAVNIDLSDYAKTADIPTTLPANGGNSDTVNNHTVKSDVPENAVFTDTTYSDATQIEHGLMSVDDKKKLDGLTKYTPDGSTITADEDGTLHGQSVDIMTVDKAGIGKPDGDTIEVSTDATISVSSKALTFSDHDTSKSGTSFTNAEDGNMLVTDCTKNLLNATMETTTQNGVTCTRNVDANGKPDGTYTLNGTATNDAFFDIFTIKGVENLKKLKGLKYICIPNGTDFSTIVTRIAVLKNGSWVTGIAPNTVIGSYDADAMVIQFVVYNGKSVSNIVFKPMLTTDLSATYDDFVPYSGYEIQSCGKNLLNVKSISNNQLAGNISVTIENGSTFILNGKYELNDIKDIYFDFSSGSISLKKNKKYIFSANGIVDKINILFRKVGTYITYVDLFTNKTKNIITPDEDLLLYFNINFTGQIDVNNLRINVQIEEVSLDTTEPTAYEPYTGETITVTNNTEAPAFGLKSHKGITHIISPANVKCVYPTNESGKGVLDSLYNEDKMLTEQKESLSVIGKCKNLLKPTLATTTKNGVTCTNNGDGTYTLNGTATDVCRFNIGSNAESNIINGNTYRAIGVPQSLGSNKVEFYDSNAGQYDDVGNGSIFTFNGSKTIVHTIYVYSGVTLNNVIIKPMLTTNLNATYDDFVPYTGDGETLTHDVAELKNNLSSSNTGAHNCVYRGKYLGNALTAEQKAQISAGTFNDLYIGDYWKIDGVNYRIAAFDYWLNSGDTQCTKHHVVIVPDSCLYTAKMNTTNVTTGAYIGSEMYTTNLEQAKTIVNDAFGSANILSHRDFLANTTKATTDPTYESSGSWYDSTVELMNERMVYGADVFHNIEVNGAIPMNYTIDKSQLPLFALESSKICNRATWWLRDVVSSARFADVSNDGLATNSSASNAYGVRPAFGITG